MIYRQDIQLLRGVAVLFVVAFHMGLSVMKSGFLGVDIFFVISGFLMASLYDSNEKMLFIYRRARRLLPSYYAVVVATLLASFVFVTKNETDQVVEQAIFSSFYLSNIGFWLQNSYFSKSEFNALLHLWSLGVEIQFYLIVPVLYFIFKRIKLSLLGIALLSVVVCFSIVSISSKTAFFMMPLRLWEFLLGWAAAVYFANSDGSARYSDNRWLGVVSFFAMFLIPLIGVDGLAKSFITGHPGLASLIVCILTVSVLATGLPTRVIESILGKFLTLLGKYSYSIYLVHFPIIVIYLSSPFMGTNLEISSAEDFLVLLCLIAVMSYLLHHFVETKVVTKSLRNIVLFPVALIFALCALLPLVQNSLISDVDKKVFHAFYDRGVHRCGMLFKVTNPREISCELNDKSVNSKYTILMVGNSHADSIKDVFVDVASSYQVNVRFLVQNNPMLSGGLTPERIVSDAVKYGVNAIVVHFDPRPPEFFSSLSKLKDIAVHHGIKITLLAPVPTYPFHVPAAVFSGVEISLSKADYEMRNKEELARYSSLAGNGLSFIPVVDIFCSDICAVKDEEGNLYYYDDGHLTLSGSRILKPVFVRIIEGHLSDI